jgi:hypothetical protein
MSTFEDLHQDRVTGSLAMFDRMIFKGRLTGLYKENGAKCFLWSQGVALKDFTPYAKWTTARIADTVRGLAEAAGRPTISFDHVKTPNYAQRKDELAKSIAEADGIIEGIICVISAVESCMSFQVPKSFKTKTIGMYRRERKCLHHYLYLMDPGVRVHARPHPGLDPLRLRDLHQRPRVAGPPTGRSGDRLSPP